MRRIDSELAFCEEFKGAVGRQGLLAQTIGEALMYGKGSGKTSYGKTRILTNIEHSKALTDLRNNSVHDRSGQLTLRSTRRISHEPAVAIEPNSSKQKQPIVEQLMGEDQRMRLMQGLKNIKMALRLVSIRYE